MALEAGLIRTALPLLLLSSGYCSHCRRDNVRTTSQPHNASGGRGLTVRMPPLRTYAPPSWV